MRDRFARMIYIRFDRKQMALPLNEYRKILAGKKYLIGLNRPPKRAQGAVKAEGITKRVMGYTPTLVAVVKAFKR